MSIASFISKAIYNYIEEDFIHGLSDACIALGATARKEYPSRSVRDNEAYKRHIIKNMDIISFFGLFGMATKDLRVAFSHESIRDSGQNGSSLAEIVYHVVRCGLLHNAEVDCYVLTENELYSNNGIIYIPKTIIVGLICSVIFSPVNKNEILENRDYILVCDPHKYMDSYLVNNLWGKRKQIHDIFSSGTVYGGGVVNGKMIFENGIKACFVE